MPGLHVQFNICCSAEHDLAARRLLRSLRDGLRHQEFGVTSTQVEQGFSDNPRATGAAHFTAGVENYEDLEVMGQQLGAVISKALKLVAEFGQGDIMIQMPGRVIVVSLTQ